MKKLSNEQMENLQGGKKSPLLCALGVAIATWAYGDGSNINAAGLSSGYDLQLANC